ncbi:MAG: hypothetical protein H6R36_178 [Chloroflexi bacterium]|nr:hypothetical protein [Chloroflexota bacterium]
MNIFLSSGSLQTQAIHLHLDFLRSQPIPDPEFVDHLAERRRQLARRIAEAIEPRVQDFDRQTAAWLIRSYPVLAIQAPVMTTLEGKIEYPGDPMCLYSALSVAADQAVKAKQATLSEGDPYNDLCPQWGSLPTQEYRLSVSDSGIRDYSDPLLNTDQTIFAPGVWNAEVKQYFVEHVLKVLEPRVVLISTVSPGHRYAIDIARTVRQFLPDTLIVLGGPHVDETMRYEYETQQLELPHSSTLQAIADGRIEPVFDFLISGDGYYALDLLMKAISIAMEMDSKTARVPDIVNVLDALAPMVGRVPGQAIIAAVDGAHVHAYPLRGRQIDLGELPSPYRAFAMRARFPIFRAADGSVQRTAHMMTATACPYHCRYCSESNTVAGQIHKFTREPIKAAIDRVCEYVSYGAEAMFFDDSIFWAGNTHQMAEFCNTLTTLKMDAATRCPEYHARLEQPSDWKRLIKLQWGAQLTAEFLTSLQSRDKALELLRSMRAAGCTYLYFGIESLAPSIMTKVHKNLNKEAWADKVRAALELVKEAGIRTGASVLFGLDGETRDTIDETIAGVATLLTDGLLDIASPNILTYHPATAITYEHQMQDKLDYDSLGADIMPPYSYFEEAFPQVVSKVLSEDDIWYIYRQTRLHWSREVRLDPYAIHADSVRDVWGAIKSEKPDASGADAGDEWQLPVMIDLQLATAELA